jgi:ABC-type phosphate transport system ATPase subunit
MARSRDRILGNLESIYREAYDRAKSTDDPLRMMDLDASYQREQLLLEVLLDIRDAMISANEAPSGAGAALGKLKKIKDLTKLR